MIFVFVCSYYNSLFKCLEFVALAAATNTGWIEWNNNEIALSLATLVGWHVSKQKSILSDILTEWSTIVKICASVALLVVSLARSLSHLFVLHAPHLTSPEVQIDGTQGAQTQEGMISFLLPLAASISRALQGVCPRAVAEQTHEGDRKNHPSKCGAAPTQVRHEAYLNLKQI